MAETETKTEIEKKSKSDASVITADSRSVAKHLKSLDNAFSAVKKAFFTIAFVLNWFNDTGAFQQVDGKAYATIADFAKDRYGISRATTYQYLSVVRKFGIANPKTGEIDAIRDEYRNYSSTALIVMSGMNDEQLSVCDSSMKVSQLKSIRDSFYLEFESVPEDGKDKDAAKLPEPPKKGSIQQNRNTQKLYEIKSIEDFEKQSEDIMKSIQKVLAQDSSVNYHVDIIMTWD